MTLFNLRLSPELQARLQAEADRRGVSRSNIARDAIVAYLEPGPENTTPAPASDIHDDWSEFGSEVIAAQRTILSSLIAKLEDAEWAAAVEPIYAVFRDMTIAKSRTYTNPSINSRNASAPYEPHVVAVLGFAADDVHEIEVGLEQLFFEYAWFAGLEAFSEIPGIWERAKARVDAGEPRPDYEQITAARVHRT
ncbi:CopG family transcriptional regulator [Sphingomonas sp.]|uniref:CopG family transcriptional regulator n=1 Tax=Sphingomonas sp. TaxID=28214 RepID=UPI00307F2007